MIVVVEIFIVKYMFLNDIDYLYLLFYFKLKWNKIRGYIFYNVNKFRNKELKIMNDLFNLYEIGLLELVKMRLFI